MNRKKLAKEIMKVADILLGMEFKTEDAMEKYLKKHPDAEKRNHSVKKENSISNNDSAEHDLNDMLESSVKTTLKPTIRKTISGKGTEVVFPLSEKGIKGRRISVRTKREEGGGMNVKIKYHGARSIDIRNLSNMNFPGHTDIETIHKKIHNFVSKAIL